MKEENIRENSHCTGSAEQLTLSQFEKTRFADTEIFDRFHHLIAKHFPIGGWPNGWDCELCRKKCCVRIGYDEYVQKHCAEEKSLRGKLEVRITQNDE